MGRDRARRSLRADALVDFLYRSHARAAGLAFG